MALPLLDVEGTAEEIQGRLADFAGQRLHVIVLPADGEEAQYPRNAIMSNGVPLFPTNGRTETVTRGHIDRLAEEE